MSSPDTLLQAAINRIKARLEQKFITLAAKATLFAKDAPEKFQQEWEIFQKEVFAEAERLDHESNKNEASGAKSSNDAKQSSPREKINYLRAKVTDINDFLEARH